MNKDEAINIVISKYPTKVIDKVSETDNYFLISISPKRNNEGDDDSVLFPTVCDDGLKAVDKKTGKVFTYNPIRHGE